MSLTTFLTEEASTEEARSRCLKIDVSVIQNLVLKVPSFFFNKKSPKKMKMEKIINFLFSSKNSAFSSFCFSQNLDKTPKGLVQVNILSHVT